MVHRVFHEREIPTAFSHGTLVLIPKPSSDEFRGIALLDVVYKLVSQIMNLRIQSKITFDDAIHGFRPGRGTGTAIMEAKLLMQLHRRTGIPLFMVFIDLKKAYDTLDRAQALRILEAYRVGPNLRLIIQTVWDGDTLVPRQSGYYGRPLKARRGVRQGDIISPLIFNIMVDAVVRHWRTQRNCDGSEETSVFYADDGMQAGADADAIEHSVGALTQGFASIGLRMNALKTKFLVMEGGGGIVNISREAYERMQTGEGQLFKERAKEKILCNLCGKELQLCSIPRHQQSKGCRKGRKTFTPSSPERERIRREAPTITPEAVPQTYCIRIPSDPNSDIGCPVDGCVYQVLGARGNKGNLLHKHFSNRHHKDTLIVEGEGLLPQCPLCGLFNKNALTEKHRATLGCKRGAERLRRLNQTERSRQVVRNVSFSVDGEAIERETQFKYLGRILEEKDDDNYAIDRQLSRAKAKWARVGKLLSATTTNPRVRGYFYKAILQAVLLYGSESRVISKSKLKQLCSFHHRVARYITGRHIRRRPDGTYEYPPTAEVLEMAGLYPLQTYITKRKQTIWQAVRTRPILERCKNSSTLSTLGGRSTWWDDFS